MPRRGFIVYAIMAKLFSIRTFFSIVMMSMSWLEIQAEPLDDLPFNQLQVIGSHNSYKRQIDPSLLKVVGWASEAAAIDLDYQHVPIDEQLDLGLRNLELDVYHDPEGGLYAKPIGRWFGQGLSEEAEALMLKPGLKVLHAQDVDYQSHCFTFKLCLKQLKDWSDKHPKHFPITILINAKTTHIDIPGSLPPLAFDAIAWDGLDAELIDILGDRLFTPSDLRGDAETLQQAIGQGWPQLSLLRGKFLFLLDDDLDKTLSYWQQRGRTAAMFADLREGHPETAMRVMNDPIKQQADIITMVKQGYVIRTRADAGTIEARNNDITRREAAFASGAQIISTDYYYADPRFEGDYQVRLPSAGIAICNPQLLSEPCALSE